MKQFLLIVAAASVAAIVFLLIIILVQPAEYSVERSQKIDAPVGAVYSHVYDLRAWEHWSPWIEREPNMEIQYPGPPRGEGAVVEWFGGEESGSGRMTITDTRTNQYIGINLEFIEPFESTNLTEFHFEGDGSGTTVIWSMSGEHTFMSKAIGLFFDMEEMIGQDYERGLANLKEVVETGGRAQTNR